ncbi:unnamed protein product, partial [Rotaria sordida]
TERADEQKEFLARLKPYLEEFPKVHTNSKSTRSIILIVPSKFLIEKSTKKQEEKNEESESIDDKSSISSQHNHKKSI